nr:transposase [Limosilactobacillus equigenerosi]
MEIIYNRLVNELRKENVIHMDETPFRVLEDDKDMSYFWTARSTQ